MKIVEAEKREYYYVTVEDEDSGFAPIEYRRYGPEIWERNYGCDWVEEWDCGFIEKLFQEFNKGKK